jgi:hypothetical protein
MFSYHEPLPKPSFINWVSLFQALGPFNGIIDLSVNKIDANKNKELNSQNPYFRTTLIFQSLFVNEQVINKLEPVPNSL